MIERTFVYCRSCDGFIGSASLWEPKVEAAGWKCKKCGGIKVYGSSKNPKEAKRA